MRKMKLTSFLMIGICSVMLVGCNKEKEEIAAEAVIEVEEENMFGLTESEQKMYAEYAAGTLMKYNAGSNMRVLEGQTLINQEAKEQAAKEQAEKRAQLAAEYEANKKNNSSKNEEQNSGNGMSGSSEGSGINYVSDMASATGTDAFSIVYEGYEITDSYPSSGDDLFMAMDARQGKVFLVTKFEVTNISSQTENFNMFSKQGKFKLNINGERYKSQYTLLLDDLSMYRGDIDAGETIDTVLIFEIPQSAASNIGDMVLSITVEDEVSAMQLQGGSGVINTDINLEEENVETDSDDGNWESIDSEPEKTDFEQESLDENQQDDEYNDLAEEYMEALEAENTNSNYSENISDRGEGNVTVVGSNRN